MVEKWVVNAEGVSILVSGMKFRCSGGFFWVWNKVFFFRRLFMGLVLLRMSILCIGFGCCKKVFSLRVVTWGYKCRDWPFYWVSWRGQRLLSQNLFFFFKKKKIKEICSHGCRDCTAAIQLECSSSEIQFFAILEYVRDTWDRWVVVVGLYKAIRSKHDYWLRFFAVCSFYWCSGWSHQTALLGMLSWSFLTIIIACFFLFCMHVQMLDRR